MVDNGTWNKLSPAEQTEFSGHRKKFIEAVLSSGTHDGWHFSREYRIVSRNNLYYLARSESDPPFADITSSSRAAIDALLTDAIQNYGR